MEDYLIKVGSVKYYVGTQNLVYHTVLHLNEAKESKTVKQRDGTEETYTPKYICGDKNMNDFLTDKEEKLEFIQHNILVTDYAILKVRVYHIVAEKSTKEYCFNKYVSCYEYNEETDTSTPCNVKKSVFNYVKFLIQLLEKKLHRKIVSKQYKNVMDELEYMPGKGEKFREAMNNFHHNQKH